MRDDLIKALEDTLARPTCEFLRIDRKAAAELLALIKPPAREDAQPVAAEGCPKCGMPSGDDWRQCGGSCPMPGSPYYTHPAPDALREAGVKALAFFKWARDFFWCDEGCEIDGGDFQDAAERFGLILQVPFDPERHADNGYGLEAGDDWYETEPAIDQALAALQAEQKGGA